MKKVNSKPNIIIFNPDQMRADTLSHLGNQASYTPNFDALADDGVSYENCFCQNPVCTPSRASFLTGLYPHVGGHRTMTYLLRKGEPNLLKKLKDSGYFVWANGRGDIFSGQDMKWIKECVNVYADVAGTAINDFAEPRGNKDSDNYFSFYQGVLQTESPNGVSYDNDVAYTDAAIKQIKNRPKNKPLCMFLALNVPHPPYKVEKKYLDKIDVLKLPPRIPTLKGDEGKPSMEYGLLKNLRLEGWTEERFDKLRAVYLGMVAKADDLFGRVVETLKQEGIYENTVIMVFSDHGDYTGDFGLAEKAQNCFPDSLTNVPLIIKPPKGFKSDKGINSNLTELLDVYSTALDFAGEESDHDNFSKSLIPSLADKKRTHREFVCCEGGRRHGELQCMESIGKTTIGINDMYNPRISLQESEGPEHTLATMLRTKEYKYVKRLYEKDEFYDLKNGESKNEIDNPNYAEAIEKHKNLLLNWYQETADTVPRNYDNRFTKNFYIAAAKNMGQPRIAVWIFAFFMKVLGKSFEETVEILQSFASKINKINK